LFSWQDFLFGTANNNGFLSRLCCSAFSVSRRTRRPHREINRDTTLRRTLFPFLTNSLRCSRWFARQIIGLARYLLQAMRKIREREQNVDSGGRGGVRHPTSETVSKLGLLWVFVSVSSCDFVDGTITSHKRTIHEITRTNTNEAPWHTRVLTKSLPLVEFFWLLRQS
jgi:hypothetical protein